MLSLSICEILSFRSSYAATQTYQGLCPPLIHSAEANYSASGRTKKVLIKLRGAHADMSLRCPHIPENTVSSVADISFHFIYLQTKTNQKERKKKKKERKEEKKKKEKGFRYFYKEENFCEFLFSCQFNLQIQIGEIFAPTNSLIYK